MSGYIILRQIQLGQAHDSTGKTHHYHGDKAVLPPNMLKIVQFPNDTGYYLLHFDKHGQELTDTYHVSLADAMAQAEWEFNIRPSEWQIVSP